jgi:iron complex transport system substrate-binding protein
MRSDRRFGDDHSPESLPVPPVLPVSSVLHAVRRTVALASVLATALAAQRITVRDGAGRPVTLEAPARRIASVVPSATDLLVQLGARGQLVARTRYDTAQALRAVTDVGGGLDPDLERLVAARPQLVIGMVSQANATWLARIAERGVATYLVDTRDTATFLRTLDGLGALSGRATEARRERDRFRAALAAARRPVTGAPLTGVYIVGVEGVYVAGPTSFIAQGLAIAGLATPIAEVRGDFPVISLETLVRRDPDVLVLPRPRTGTQLDALRAKPGWRDLRAVRQGRVLEVPGEPWIRPGLHFPVLVQALRAQVDSVRMGR